MTTKTKIDWCDYTINPVKGLCPVGCSYCYARAMYHRFKWDPEIRLALDAFQPLRATKRPCRVFVGSTMELFGEWVSREWLIDIFSLCDSYKRAGHTFIFLTKKPQNLIKWSPFPDNCWVGVTATDLTTLATACRYLSGIHAPVKFVSVEPLLDWAVYGDHDLPRWLLQYAGINWLIIGQCTPVRKSTMPKAEWVSEIVQAADRVGTPVFIKDNLFDLLDCDRPEANCAFDKEGQYRQESPKATQEAK